MDPRFSVQGDLERAKGGHSTLPGLLAFAWSWVVFAAAWGYIGLLAVLVAEEKLPDWGSGPGGFGQRRGLASAASLFYSMWPASVNSWALVTTERSYAEDCRLFTWEKENKLSNLTDTLLDEFALAHLIGWWAKALIFRNRCLLWMLSLGFEACEVLLKPYLPNFRECWWDSIILDILLCNWIGMELGMLTLRAFNMVFYKWEQAFRSPVLEPLIGGLPSEKENGVELLHGSRLRRCTVTPDDAVPTVPYKTSSSVSWLSQFTVPAFICICALIVELLGFFIKNLLRLQPLHPFNTLRLLLWGALALPALQELNTWLFATSGTSQAQDLPPLFLCLVFDVALAETVFVSASLL